MLTLSELREHLNPDCKLSDEELIRLRDELYTLAELVVDLYLDERKKTRCAVQVSP